MRELTLAQRIAIILDPDWPQRPNDKDAKWFTLGKAERIIKEMNVRELADSLGDLLMCLKRHVPEDGYDNTHYHMDKAQALLDRVNGTSTT